MLLVRLLCEHCDWHCLELIYKVHLMPLQQFSPDRSLRNIDLATDFNEAERAQVITECAEFMACVECGRTSLSRKESKCRMPIRVTKSGTTPISISFSMHRKQAECTLWYMAYR